MSQRTPPAQRSDYVEFQTVATRWMDNDCYGHLNNTVHYSLFDTIVNAWLIQNGVLTPNGGGSIGLVVESGCVYHSEISFPDLVHVGFRVGHLGKSSVRYEFGIFRNDEMISTADGFFVHVFVNSEDRRPEPFSEKARQILETLVK